jgi:2-methylcitrate dehydratase PrpD
MNEISQFICETRYEDIPDETVAYTKALMSKIIAAMLVGANNVAGQRAIAYTKANNNSTEAGAIGTGKRFALEDAIFVNGITSHAAELEDDQFPSATSDITIFPVVFPLAEILNVSGKELITASAIGIEVMHRVGRFPLSSKGITDLPFYGVIGSAVTSAKLMNLNVDQVKSAIGIAIGRAGGYLANFGTDAHYIESAAACQDGVKAAKLAQLGMTGTWDLEGWLTHVCKGTEFDLGLITENLGSPKWRVHETWIKKYPCCFLTHRHIDMMIDIVSERSIRAEDIDHVDIHVGPVDNVCNRPSPHDTEAARFSFHHIMGAIMVDGDVDSHHFTEDGLNDERIRSVWDKTNVICHEEWPAEFMSGTARIEVTLTDKTVVMKEALQARGGPDEPLTAKEIEALYRKYTSPVLSSSMIDRTWEMIKNLEHHETLKDLTDLLVNPKL